MRNAVISELLFYSIFSYIYPAAPAVNCNALRYTVGIYDCICTQTSQENSIQSVYDAIGVNRNTLARDIDVPVSRISDAVAGMRGVSPHVAMRCSEYFGTTAELWLRLQTDDDFYVARTTFWQAAAAMFFGVRTG